MMVSNELVVAMAAALFMVAVVSGVVGFCVGMSSCSRIWHDMLDAANGKAV